MFCAWERSLIYSLINDPHRLQQYYSIFPRAGLHLLREKEISQSTVDSLRFLGTGSEDALMNAVNQFIDQVTIQTNSFLYPIDDDTELVVIQKTQTENKQRLNKLDEIKDGLGFLKQVYEEIPGDQGKRRAGESKACHSARSLVRFWQHINSLILFNGLDGKQRFQHPENLGRLIDISVRALVFHDFIEDIEEGKITLGDDKKTVEISAFGHTTSLYFEIGTDALLFIDLLNALSSPKTAEKLTPKERSGSEAKFNHLLDSAAKIAETYTDYGNDAAIFLFLKKIADREDNLATDFEIKDTRRWYTRERRKRKANLLEGLNLFRKCLEQVEELFNGNTQDFHKFFEKVYAPSLISIVSQLLGFSIERIYGHPVTVDENTLLIIPQPLDLPSTILRNPFANA